MSQGGGGLINHIVFAKTSKHALLLVIESLPEEAPEWQWPGWQVQVFERKEAFFVKP